MKTRGVIGKRIVAIRQSREHLGGGRSPTIVVECLVLEDGTELHPVTIENDTGEYGHDFRVDVPPVIGKCVASTLRASAKGLTCGEPARHRIPAGPVCTVHWSAWNRRGR